MYLMCNWYDEIGVCHKNYLIICKISIYSSVIESAKKNDTHDHDQWLTCWEKNKVEEYKWDISIGNEFDCESDPAGGGNCCIEKSRVGILEGLELF